MGKEVQVDNWTLTEAIGHGSFATVWKAYHKETNKVAAVKEINTERLNKKLLESLASEIAVLQRVNHPHIVNLYETIKRPEKSRIYLVLEYCSGGDLSRYVQEDIGTVCQQQQTKHKTSLHGVINSEICSLSLIPLKNKHAVGL